MKIELSRIEQYNIVIRNSLGLRITNRVDIILSLPMPDIVVPSLYWHYFLYSSVMTARESTIDKPVAHIKVDIRNMKLVDTNSIEDSFSDINTAFPFTIHHTEMPEIKAEYWQELYQLYDVALRWYPNHPAGIVGLKLSQKFQQLIPSPLMPYYMSLNQDFWAWLNNRVNRDNLT